MAKVKVKKKAVAKGSKPKPAAARPVSSTKNSKPAAKAKVKDKERPKSSARIETRPLKRKAEPSSEKAPAKIETPKPLKKPTAEMLQIREGLVQLLADFRKEIDHEVGGARERDLAHINDTSDMATDAAEGDLALRIAESETVEAAEIERAIDKIDHGTYGLCETCNARIPVERLKVLPFATQCVKCQELADIRKRSRGGDELDDLNTEGGDMDE